MTIGHLRSGVRATGGSSPLTISLLRDITPPDTITVDDLLDTARFPTAASVTNHLLDQAITAAYSPQPGKPLPRYSPETAHRTLTFIAERLRNNNTRDLAWWHIPNWLPPTSRVLVVPALAGAIGALVTMSAIRFITGRWSFDTTSAGLAVSLEISFMIVIHRNERPARFFVTGNAKVVSTAVLAAGALFGVGAALAASVLTAETSALSAGLVVGLVAVLGFAVVVSLNLNDLSKVGDPRELWRGDLVQTLAASALMGLLAGLILGISLRLDAGLILGFVFTLAFLLQSNTVWRVPISQLYLAARHGTPLRLGRFLADAHDRHLLRTVGPVYQFRRHATLQDRLAPQRTTPPPAL